MCIMEIHARAANATMAQALAHNASTWDRDADMLIPVLEGRGHHEAARTVRDAQAKVHAAYAMCLGLFAEFAAAGSSDQDGHVHVGSERTVAEIVNSATRQARKDETR